MTDSRVLDNPADMSMREQQKQQRLAQGKALAEQKEAEKDRPVREYSVPFMFRFRQIKNGSFRGLWELAAMKPQGKVVDEIIVDANSLPEVLETIGNIFANLGY